MRQRRTQPYLVKMGGKIQKIRMSKGLTVRKLGELVGIDYGALSRIETGQKNSHILTLKAIADALGVQIKDFL